MPKYSNYTAKFKLNVLSCADANGVKAAGRHFSIDPNSILYWRRQNNSQRKETMKQYIVGPMKQWKTLYYLRQQSLVLSSAPGNSPQWLCASESASNSRATHVTISRNLEEEWRCWSVTKEDTVSEISWLCATVALHLPQQQHTLNMSLYTQGANKRQKTATREVNRSFDANEFFPGLSHVEYRPDAGPEDTLCYRYYNATERIHGRTMEDWLRPAISFWHAFHCSSTDYTQGHQSPHRSWDDGTNTMENCKRRLKAAFEFYTKIGCKYWTLYDRDVSPEGDTFEDTNHHLDEVSDLIMELQQRTGIKPLWVASNLHSHPRYIHGASTSPEVQVIAQAGAQMKKALELAHKLGAECFLFQSTQEGYCSVLNTDMSRELRNYSRHLKMLQDFKERISFRGQLLIQPSFDNDHNEGNSYKTYYKRDEIPKYHYNWDPTSTLTFLKHYNLDRFYKLSVSPGHQLYLTSTYGMLGSVDITSSTTRPNIREATLLMKTIIEQGGIQPGGLNFGLPLRRESVDLKDLMVAYISYIDIYARGLRNAAKIIADGVFAKNLQQQYLSYHTGFGSRFTSGEANLEDCEEQAQKHQELVLQWELWHQEGDWSNITNSFGDELDEAVRH